MDRWKKGFEIALWNSRLIVVFAVIPSVIAGLALFGIIAVQTLLDLANLLHWFDPGMALEQKEALLKDTIVHLFSAIDGYLLGAFMLIFGFGLYELFLTDLAEARLSRGAGKVLQIRSLDDLKERLAKVILIILIVETFKDAVQLKALSPLELFYVGATIALIGLALYLTHGSESEDHSEPTTPPDKV
jgi:uncharacterized membrane protein YqhA